MKRILLSLIAFAGVFANAFALDDVPAWQNDWTSAPDTEDKFYLYNTSASGFAAKVLNDDADNPTPFVAPEDAALWKKESNCVSTTYKKNGKDVTYYLNMSSDAVFTGSKATGNRSWSYSRNYSFICNSGFFTIYYQMSGINVFTNGFYYLYNNSGLDVVKHDSQNSSYYEWFLINETQYKNHVAYQKYYDALNISASEPSKAWRDKYLKFENYEDFVSKISTSEEYISKLEELTAKALEDGGWNINPEKYALFDEGGDYAGYNFNKEGMKKVEVHRTFYCGEWNTFCLPFNIEKENLCDDDIKMVKKLSSVDNSDGGYYLHFGDTEDIFGGDSYIVWVEGEKNKTVEKVFYGDGMNLTKSNPDPVDGVKFQGVYSKGTVPAHSYILNDNKFYHVAEGVTVNISGFRGYFVMPTDIVPQGALNASFDDEDVTGINFVNENEYENENMFNIAGQRVNANAKGIIIKNGKKYLVK